MTTAPAYVAPTYRQPATVVQVPSSQYPILSIGVDYFPNGVDVYCKKGVENVDLFHREQKAYIIVHCKGDKRLYRIRFLGAQ